MRKYYGSGPATEDASASTSQAAPKQDDQSQESNSSWHQLLCFVLLLNFMTNITNIKDL